MEVSMVDAPGDGDGGVQFAFTSAPRGAGAARGRKKPCSKPNRQRRQNKKDFHSHLQTFRNDLRKFVDAICEHLNEKKFLVVEIAVEMLGTKMVSDLVKEVDAIESRGGQLTQDGSRRRTPGGVLLNLLKSKLEPDLYKEITSTSRERAVQFAKRRRPIQDHQQNQKRKKRRKLVSDDVPVPMLDDEKEEGELDEIEPGEIRDFDATATKIELEPGQIRKLDVAATKIKAGRIRDLDAATNDDDDERFQLPTTIPPIPDARQTVGYGDLV